MTLSSVPSPDPQPSPDEARDDAGRSRVAAGQVAASALWPAVEEHGQEPAVEQGVEALHAEGNPLAAPVEHLVEQARQDAATDEDELSDVEVEQLSAATPLAITVLTAPLTRGEIESPKRELQRSARDEGPDPVQDDAIALLQDAQILAQAAAREVLRPED